MASAEDGAEKGAVSNDGPAAADAEDGAEKGAISNDEGAITLLRVEQRRQLGVEEWHGCSARFRR